MTIAAVRLIVEANQARFHRQKCRIALALAVSAERAKSESSFNPSEICDRSQASSAENHKSD
jgi:hypothetical protein